MLLKYVLYLESYRMENSVHFKSGVTGGWLQIMQRALTGLSYSAGSITTGKQQPL